MTEEQLGLVPESLRVEENNGLFETHETFESLLGDLIGKAGNLDKVQGELIEAQKGLDGTVRIPGEDATEEEVKAFRSALGVPESIDGYGLSELEKEEQGKALLASFIDVGLTKAQAKKQVELIEKVGKDTEKEKAAAQKAALEEFKTSLGDKAEETFSLAKSGIEAFFKDEESKETISGMILNDPALVKAFSRIGGITKESPGILSIGKGGSKSKNLYKSMEGLDD